MPARETENLRRKIREKRDHIQTEQNNESYSLRFGEGEVSCSFLIQYE